MAARAQMMTCRTTRAQQHLQQRQTRSAVNNTNVAGGGRYVYNNNNRVVVGMEQTSSSRAVPTVEKSITPHQSQQKKSENKILGITTPLISKSMVMNDEEEADNNNNMQDREQQEMDPVEKETQQEENIHQHKEASYQHQKQGSRPSSFKQDRHCTMEQGGFQNPSYQIQQGSKSTSWREDPQTTNQQQVQLVVDKSTYQQGTKSPNLGEIRIPPAKQRKTTMISTLTEDQRDSKSLPVQRVASTLDFLAKTRQSSDNQLENQRDPQMKLRVESYVRSTLFHKIKFISDQDDLGNLRSRTSTGNVVMDNFRVSTKLLDRHRWWILYQDVVKKALEQQRANCNTYIKEVVVGKSYCVWCFV
jgi:hypothetical protein